MWRLRTNWNSSVSTVSDYRLHDRSSIPGTGNRLLSSLCVQTSSEAHPASYPTDTGGKERPKRDADHSPPSSAEVKNKQELCQLFPRSLHGVAWQLYFFSVCFYWPSIILSLYMKLKSGKISGKDCFFTKFLCDIWQWSPNSFDHAPLYQ